MSIPKIINQLWIGDRPRPVNAMNSIRDMNPSYKYMLWNEESIKANLVINPKYKRKIEQHHGQIEELDVDGLDQN